MKKIFLLLTVFSMVFTSCDPLEDIHEEVDAQTTTIVGDVVFTMSDEDYKFLDLSFGNFSSEEDAKSMIPNLLDNKYPVWGNKSSAIVTYKLYNKKNDEKSLVVYEVTNADNTAIGNNYGNFSNLNALKDLLNYKFPAPADRLLVSLTYEQYDSGVTSTVENGFIFSNGDWEMHSGITEAEYNSMGEGRAQFSSEDEALVKIPLFLKNKLQYEAPNAGDIEGTMYKLYVDDVDDVDGDGSTKDRTVYSYVAFFIFDGMTWSKYNNVINETVKFGHDGTTWVPDNTIKYTLTAADYTLVDNGFYQNFDVRAGKAEADESVRLGKINTILLNNFPNDAEGQKYSVSYNVYNGADAVWILNVIKKGAEYVKQ